MTTTPPDSSPLGQLGAGALFALGGALLLVLVGYWPTAALAGQAGVLALVIAVGAALVGSWSGAVAPLLMVRAAPQQFVAAYFLGLGTRFALTLLAALVLPAILDVPRTPLLLWVGIAQAALLAIDTVYLGLLVRPRREAQ
jgi:hypothetical protein